MYRTGRSRQDDARDGVNEEIQPAAAEAADRDVAAEHRSLPAFFALGPRGGNTAGFVH